MSGQVVAADLVWTGRRFEPDIALRVDAEGRIAVTTPSPRSASAGGGWGELEACPV